MNLRSATEADEALLSELWQEFEAECPEPPGFAPESWEGAWGRIRAALADGAVTLALDEEGGAGLAWMLAPERGRSRLELVYVRRVAARRRPKVLPRRRACLAAIAAKGATSVSLEVLEANTTAPTVWHRLGFEEVARVMSVALEPLVARLGEARPWRAAPRGDPRPQRRRRHCPQRRPHLDRPRGRPVLCPERQLEHPLHGDPHYGRAVKLYDAARCPYCARVRLVLAEKGCAFEAVEVDLAQRPQWSATSSTRPVEYPCSRTASCCPSRR